MHYYTRCKEVNGTLITIFHNNFLGSDKTFSGWREMYEQLFTQLEHLLLYVDYLHLLMFNTQFTANLVQERHLLKSAYCSNSPFIAPVQQ